MHNKHLCMYRRFLIINFTIHNMMNDRIYLLPYNSILLVMIVKVCGTIVFYLYDLIFIIQIQSARQYLNV